MYRSGPKLAVCFFGQPRDYKAGYKVFQEFFQSNQINPSSVDFFFHAWTIPPTETFYASPYRKISPSEISFNPNVESELLDLYKPKRYRFESQKSPEFYNKEQFANTLAYRNLQNQKKMDNIPNVLSQLYSIQSVRDIFHEYITETGAQYDFVIISRFDFKGDLRRVHIKNYDYRKHLLLPENHHPRKLISGSILFLPQSVFLTWMNMYMDLNKIVDNHEIAEILLKNGEKLHFNTEEIFTALYLYHYKNNENVLYFKPAIWFSNNL